MTLLPPVEQALRDAVERRTAATPRTPARTRRRYLKLAGVVAAAGLSVTAMAAAAGFISDRTPAPQADTRLPVAGTGRTAALSDYRGKVLIVSFYASWCRPCRQQAVIADRIGVRLQAAGTGATALVDYTDDSVEPALGDLKRMDVSAPLLEDPDGQVSAAYGIHAIPATFILDANGKIAYVRRGLADAAALRAGVARAEDRSAPGPPADAIVSERASPP